MERLRAERFATRGAGSKVTGVVEPPFPVPASWAWARLDHLWRSITDGDHQPPPKSERGVAFLTIGNVSRGKLDFTATRYVPDTYFSNLDELRVPSRGDLLYTVVGSYGIPMMVDTERPFCVQRHIAILKPLPSTNVAFVHRLMESDFIYRQAHDAATGIAQPTVGLGALRNFVVPVPPFAEQKRIVAMVDQLIALCDDLEARQTKKRETGTRLTRSALEALTTAEGPEAFDAAWKRVVENFDVIIDEAEKVHEMRRRLLALAISGRLCRSKDSDGTAQTELPGLLTARNEQVGKEPVAPAFANLPIIPPGWCWTSLDSLLVVLRNGVSTRPEGTEGVPVLRISAVRPNAVNMTEIRFLPGTPNDYVGAFVKPGDLLFTRYSGNAEFVGACGVVPEGAKAVVHPDKLIRGEVVPGLVDARFVSLAMSTGASRAYIDQCGQTTAGQIGISGKQLKAAPVPLAPLAVQRRIVAKVEQLMKICDDLEAKLRLAEDRAAKLVEAVVHELVS